MAKLATVSPTHRVPVLHIDGLVIWESIAIAELLHERAPDAGISPEEATARVARDLHLSRCAEGSRARALRERRDAFGFWRASRPDAARRARAPHRARDTGVARRHLPNRADLARVPHAQLAWRRFPVRRVVRRGRDVRAGREPLSHLRRGPVARRAAVRRRGLEAARARRDRRGGGGRALVARSRAQSMTGDARELALAELEAGLDHIRASPRDAGTLEMIVRRPRSGEREVLAAAPLPPDGRRVRHR